MSGNPCAVEGCDRPTSSRGYCTKHYSRWWKHGDVHRRTPTWEERLEEVREWVQQHGHLPRQRRDRGRDENRHANWIWVQTRKARAGELAAERVEALRDLGVDIDNAQQEQREREYIAAVDAAIAEYGGIEDIPFTHEVAKWLYLYRVHLRDGTGSVLLRGELAKRGLQPAAPKRLRRVAAWGKTQQQCAVEGCEKARSARVWCAGHYHAWLLSGTPIRRGRRRICVVEGCGKYIRTDTWCLTHLPLVEAGHGRTAYRNRSRECGGRCEVCRADHLEEQRQARRNKAEKVLPFTARRELVGDLWEGTPLDKACARVGVEAEWLWRVAPVWWGFVEALDDALMAGRDPELDHGSMSAYRSGCRCPECRQAKARDRGEARARAEAQTT